MKTFFERFNKPLSDFDRDNMDKIIGAAKRCLNTPEGPVGHLTDRELLYQTAQQDMVKYILSLTNDT
jgi:hypothetical protein